MKTIRHRRLLIALIVIIVGVLVGLVWLVWPERSERLTLKFVRSEVIDGNSKLLFRLEGADQYRVFIKGFFYIHGDDQTLVALNGQTGRQFYAEPLLYSENGPITQMRAGVFVLVLDTNFSRFYWCIRDAWSLRKESKLPILSHAKSLWQRSVRVVSNETITSDVFTNTPPQ